MAADPRIPGLSFGEVADDFDRVRLGYPDALIHDVLSYSGAVPSALEVGAGTGKATLAFAAAGVPIVAIEPDPAMAAVLRRHAAALPDVRIEVATFEAYRPDREFGLLFSADAWHWTRPDRRWSLARGALGAGGALALFWNEERFDDDAQRQALVDVFAATAPTLTVHDGPTEESRLWTEWPGAELAGTDGFTDLAGRIYRRAITVSGADYLTHLSTRSGVRMLAEPVRDRMLASLADVFDGPVRLTVYTALYLARRT